MPKLWIVLVAALRSLASSIVSKSVERLAQKGWTRRRELTDRAFVREVVEDVAGLDGFLPSLAKAKDEVDPLAEVRADVFRLEGLR